MVEVFEELHLPPLPFGDSGDVEGVGLAPRGDDEEVVGEDEALVVPRRRALLVVEAFAAVEDVGAGDLARGEVDAPRLRLVVPVNAFRGWVWEDGDGGREDGECDGRKDERMRRGWVEVKGGGRPAVRGGGEDGRPRRCGSEAAGGGGEGKRAAGSTRCEGSWGWSGSDPTAGVVEGI